MIGGVVAPSALLGRLRMSVAYHGWAGVSGGARRSEAQCEVGPDSCRLSVTIPVAAVARIEERQTGDYAPCLQ